MRKQPIFITVIGWILIACGGFSGIIITLNLLSNFKEVMSQQPLMRVLASYAFSYVGVLISSICGIGILKARNWARFLYVIWSVISLVGLYRSWGAFREKTGLLVNLIFFLVITFSLFSPKANKYFTGAEIQGDL